MLVARQVFLVVTENDQMDRHTTKYDLVLISLGWRGGGLSKPKGTAEQTDRQQQSDRRLEWTSYSKGYVT